MTMPPPFWFGAVSALLPRSERTEIRADLLEWHQDRVRRQPRWRSNAWLFGHTLRTALRLRLDSQAKWLDGFRFDCSQVIQSLMHARGFTAIAVLTFALGMGANIAVFTVFDTLLFRPLPYQAAERLVQVRTVAFKDSWAASTYEVNLALQAEATSFNGLAWTSGTDRLTTPLPGENPLVLSPVTANALDVLGVHPVRGRGFEPGDATVGGGDTAVILTHDAWRARFGQASDVIGRTWGRDQRYQIVGVLPPGFLLPSSRFVERGDGLFVERWNAPTNGLLTVAPFARLRDDVSLEAARSEIALISQRHGWESRTEPVRIALDPLQSGLAISVGPYLWLTSSAVWLVLAVACVNLSTMLLMRGRSRQQLGAVRAALGASPARLIRLAFLEAGVLSMAGGALAWLVCAWAGQAIQAIVPATLRGFAVTALDPRIVAISMLATAASALAAGALPALAARRIDVLSLLRGSAAAPGRRSSLHAGRWFLGIEAAFATVVVIGAAIAVPAFSQFVLRPHGFDAANLYNIELGRDRDDGLNTPARADRVRAVLDIIGSLPRVAGASAALNRPYQAPFNGTDAPWSIGTVSGSTWAIGAGVFHTMGTPLRAGREFTPDEIAAASAVAVINETAARALWPGTALTALIGRRIDTVTGPRAIVGIAGDIRLLPTNATKPAVFLPITAPELPPSGVRFPIIVRMLPGAVPDQELITARLRERFPNARVRLVSLEEELGEVLDRPRFLAMLFGVLAGVALLLAVTGVYAVAAFEALNQRHEVAIRLALGAAALRILGTLVGHIGRPILAGTMVGLMIAWIGARTFRAGIAELESIPAGIFPVAALVVLGATLIAMWRPTRNVTRVDPAEELRSSR